MTTELDAVNEILTQAGYFEILTTAELISVPEAKNALTILTRISREEQSKSYYFNTEDNVEITLDGSGEYVIPTDILRVDPYYAYTNYVQRGGKLYDIKEQTSVIGEASGSLQVNLVRQVPYEDLPETAKNYFLKRAIRTFLSRYHGERELLEMSRQDEIEAKVAFDSDNFESSDYNMLDASDNADIYYGRWYNN